MDLADLRIEYGTGDDPAVAAVHDPLALLASWLEHAVASGVREPYAMALATVDATGAPSSRMVLLREIADGELRFFTNLESPKALDLRREPRCALTFWWGSLERQVRVSGRAALLPRERASVYFASRPRGSQLGAWASPQSRPLASRADLEARLAEVSERFGDDPVTLPPHWGGFTVVPTAVEFWQGRRSRLHDRVLFEREGQHWVGSLLAP
jgi:pyridoxamine 5'-phosphate oxidase